MQLSNVWLLSGAIGVALISVGCGGGQNTADNIRQQTQAKLEAMKQLADALEKKDQQLVSGAIEALISSNMDVKASPEAAKELLEVYQKRVKGKLKGDEATQVKGVVDEIEKAMKG